MNFSARIEALETLARLHSSGALSDEEYAAEKVRLLTSNEGASLTDFDQRQENHSLSVYDNQPVWAGCQEYNEGAGSAQQRTKIIAAAFVLLLGSLAYWQFATDGGLWPLGKQEHNDLPALDDIIVFSDPNKCDFYQHMENIFYKPMWSSNNLEIKNLGNLVVMKKKYEGEFIEYSVKTEGYWRGLRVSRIATSGWPGSDVFTNEIRFFENPETVLISLNEYGFDLKEVGIPKIIPEDDYDTTGITCSIKVEAAPGGSKMEFGIDL
ncbi:MAG: SHOCT domain-containing protein [Novosphingobium sp.]